MNAIIFVTITMCTGVALGLMLNMGDIVYVQKASRLMFWYMLAYIAYWFIYMLINVPL